MAGANTYVEFGQKNCQRLLRILLKAFAIVYIICIVYPANLRINN